MGAKNGKPALDPEEYARLPDLHRAAHDGDKPDLKKHARRADLDALDFGRRSALYWAVAQGHLECAKWLLKKGANTRCRDPEGMGLLHRGCVAVLFFFFWFWF
jgi:ankyrin repeat protein